jgi:geranylgeranyl diphosphate synthase type II
MIKQFYEKHCRLVDKSLNKYMPKSGKIPAIIHESMRYSVFAGGKRLRPVLTLASGTVFGADIKTCMPAACAIELVHTYSLIHDDLPCMDNDDYRRGMLTNHKKFGENIAVLAGDALLTESFHIISKYSDPKHTPELVRLLSYYSSTEGMLGGQVLDILNEGSKPDIKTVKTIHLKKTAALIKCSIMMGAVCAGITGKKMKLIESFGNKIGLGFQIVDDVLDIVSTTEELGKPVGSDIEKNKMTYPSVIGIEKSLELANTMLRDSLKILDNFKENTELLKGIAELLILRKK